MGSSSFTQQIEYDRCMYTVCFIQSQLDAKSMSAHKIIPWLQAALDQDFKNQQERGYNFICERSSVWPGTSDTTGMLTCG